jgi:hypothetical protein
MASAAATVPTRNRFWIGKAFITGSWKKRK